MTRAEAATHSPWINAVARMSGRDGKGARIQAMRRLLSQLDYANKDTDLVATPDPLLVGRASQLFEDHE